MILVSRRHITLKPCPLTISKVVSKLKRKESFKIGIKIRGYVSVTIMVLTVI